jgi:hypothetical protein
VQNVENLHLINLRVGRKSSREVVSNYILPKPAQSVAQMLKLDYATGVKFRHRPVNYLRSLFAQVADFS